MYITTDATNNKDVPWSQKFYKLTSDFEMTWFVHNTLLKVKELHKGTPWQDSLIQQLVLERINTMCWLSGYDVLLQCVMWKDTKQTSY